VRKAAELLAGKAAILQINTDTNPALASRFGVRGIPVLHLLLQGKTEAQLAGSRPAEAIVAWFRDMVGER